MSGPFTLRYLHLFLKEKSPGAFILSRNGRSADFVGGSGKDLAEAIRHAARESEYRYFWFDYASSAKEAHDLEHSWYHRYRPSDNPAPPNSVVSSAWRCTIRGCAACALAAAR